MSIISSFPENHNMDIIDIPFDYAKMRIQNKNYSNIKLVSCVMYILNKRDTVMEEILKTIVNNKSLNNEKLNFFCFCFYFYRSLINSLAIALKDNYNTSKHLKNFYKDIPPVFLIYGETLTHLTLGILFTECMNTLNSIENTNLFKFSIELYDYFYSKYVKILLVNSNSVPIQIDNILDEFIPEFINKLKDYQ